jgi:hypothetical protein
MTAGVEVQVSTSIAVVAAGWIAASCGGPPCRGQDDCPVGYYCVLDIGGPGSPSGECVYDCFTSDDCEQPADRAARAVCTNSGQCRTEARPPKLRVIEPEPDTIYPDGTRTIRVTGEVETIAEAVSVSAFLSGNGNCAGGPPQTVTVRNDRAGQFTEIPFVIDRIFVDSGATTLNVVASVGTSKQTDVASIEIACPGCAEIDVVEPRTNLPVAGLLLPRLFGSVDPGMGTGVWRVHSTAGDVFDGPLPIQNGTFLLDRVPIFAGANRVEVLVTGVGEGLGESRCSVPVGSSVARERGLRVVLSWDGPTSDLDLHLVGPGGVFGDPTSTLSPRSLMPGFGGDVLDDFMGYGPEVLTLADVGDGVYGIAVEPVFDAFDPGANAVLRVIGEGRSLTAGPIGPRFVSARAGDLWIVGTVEVAGDSLTWQPVDMLVRGAAPPTRPPSDWPAFF